MLGPDKPPLISRSELWGTPRSRGRRGSGSKGKREWHGFSLRAGAEVRKVLLDLIVRYSVGSFYLFLSSQRVFDLNPLVNKVICSGPDNVPYDGGQ